MKKILIVDDEFLILFGLSKTLDDLAEVKTVDSGEKACAEIRSCFYDICFLDVFLPDLNGLAVMEEIRKRSPKTMVFIMTGFIEENLKKEIENKADLFLEKPFDLGRIKSMVRQTLYGRPSSMT